MSKRLVLGAAIKAIREAQGRKGSVFASDCLMSHAHLVNIEAGRKQPSLETTFRIAAMLRVPVEAISYTTAPVEAVA